MDILLAPEILLDLSDPCAAAHGPARAAFDAARGRGARLWGYVGAVDRLGAASGDGAGAEGRRVALRSLGGSLQWLAALAGDARALGEPDPLAAQLRRALARLGPGALLLTRDPALLAGCPGAVAPVDLSARPVPERPLEFTDLFRQQDRIREALEDRLAGVLRHGRYILGPEVDELETRLARYVGVGHCIAVASGTDSLLIALMALGIGPGDEVVTVPYTWISTAEVVQLLGARPVFVDIDPRTCNLDPTRLDAAIGPRTRALLPVSIFGQCAEMETICAVAQRHGNLPVIEDAAQSFGAERFGARSGALSSLASTSFFPSKPLGGYGDGGALFAEDATMAERIRQIRNHGQSARHLHPRLGLNGRLDTLQAAVLLAKLDVFDDEIALRRAVARRYDILIAERVPEAATRVLTPVVAPGNVSVYAQYTVQVDRRDAVLEGFARRGIPAVAYYARPLHLQPVFASLGYRPGAFPVAERIAARGLSLPMGPYISETEQQHVVEALAGALRDAGAGEVAP